VAQVEVDRSRAPAFGLADELAPFGPAPHAHAKHQILYVSAGTLHLEVGRLQWVLPPQRAAFIRAGMEHAAEARAAAEKGPAAVAKLREVARAELRIRAKDGGAREPWPTVPAALVGVWQLGSGHVDIAGIESGRLQAAGGSLERLVIHPDGRYEHTLVMRQPNHTVATHETGVVRVAGPQLQLVALSTRGFQQYGRKRTPIGPRRQKATQHHWTIRPGRVPYLVLDGKRLLARLR
jgi:hypothetical protein